MDVWFSHWLPIASKRIFKRWDCYHSLSNSSQTLVCIQITREVCYNTDYWAWPPVSGSVSSGLTQKFISISNPFPDLRMLIQGLHFENYWPREEHNMVPGKSAPAKKADWIPWWDIPEPQKHSRPWKKYQDMVFFDSSTVQQLRLWLAFPHISKR